MQLHFGIGLDYPQITDVFGGHGGLFALCAPIVFEPKEAATSVPDRQLEAGDVYVKTEAIQRWGCNREAYRKRAHQLERNFCNLHGSFLCKS